MIKPVSGQSSESPSCRNPRLCPISCATVAAEYRKEFAGFTSFTFTAYCVHALPVYANPMVPPSKLCPDSTESTSASANVELPEEDFQFVAFVSKMSLLTSSVAHVTVPHAPF